MESSITSVSDFYFGKNVFITGVTGYLAKSVVEKLLRTTEVNRIYVLMREKRGVDVKSRLDQVKNNFVFDRVKKEKGEEILEKLVPVTGDIEKENLDLSDLDKKVLLSGNVHVVFHSAATLDFEQNAKLVININLLGTRRMLQFCSKIGTLQAFIYVSTAYVNSNKTFAVEKLYPRIGNVDDYLALLKLGDEEANRKLEKLMNGHVNSYTVSKSLAEYEVHSYSQQFPTAIVRPSMIVGAWREPFPGWTDTKNGPTGFFMGAGMGVIRRLPVNRNLVYDYIPVDIVTNGLIAAGWWIGTKRLKETQIFHCTSSTANPFSWRLIDHAINTMLINYPLTSVVWYPTLKLHKSFMLFRISTLFLHFLPGIFFDILLKIYGRKPKLVKMHYRVDSSLRRLAPFIFKEWFFDSSNTDALQESLSQKDKVTYNLDIRTINYAEFFENAIIGIRRYISKEPDETLEKARRKLKIFYFLNRITEIIFFFIVWWLFASLFQLDSSSCIWILPTVYFLFSFL